MANILMIDHDREFCAIVSSILRADGFEVETEHCGARGRARFNAPGWDLVVIDIAVPAVDGWSLLQELRQDSRLPVILLSDGFTAEAMVAGLDLGADDFLAKPVLPNVLAARIRALLRRCAAPTEPVDCGLLRLDPGRAEAFYSGRPLKLTAMEYAILFELARRPAEPISRDDLARRLHQRPSLPFDRTVDTHVARIRRKLGPAASLIRSVRGSGYKLLAAPPP